VARIRYSRSNGSWLAGPEGELDGVGANRLGRTALDGVLHGQCHLDLGRAGAEPRDRADPYLVRAAASQQPEPGSARRVEFPRRRQHRRGIATRSGNDNRFTGLFLRHRQGAKDDRARPTPEAAPPEIGFRRPSQCPSPIRRGRSSRNQAYPARIYRLPTFLYPVPIYPRNSRHARRLARRYRSRSEPDGIVPWSDRASAEQGLRSG
jgi:hypothetical protein